MNPTIHLDGTRRRDRPLRRRLLPAVLATVVAVGGCAPPWQAAGDDLPLPDPVPTVEVRLTDDDLSLDSAAPPAGHVVFHVRNAGTRDHRLELFPMGEDWAPIHEEIANDTSRPVRPRAQVPTLAPGETGRFAVDLAAGQRYGLMDRSAAPNDARHFELGVAGEFTAQPQASPSPIPPATPEQ